MKTALATVSISGTLREKMEAASKAGFQGVEIFENDLTQFAGSPVEVGKMAKDLGLEIIALQPFRDMEGNPRDIQKKRVEMLKRKMQVAHELGTNRLLMCCNVQPYASADRELCAADLRHLAEIAASEELILGYEALAWGKHIADYEDAWDLVKRADHPNLGINLDTFHMLSRGNTLDCLRDEITVDKIALVQVADAPVMPRTDYLTYSRHSRCFPGQGDMPVVEFVQVLKDKGFDDYLSHEIFNDEFRSSDPVAKAVDGMRSLIWLDDQTTPKHDIAIDNIEESASIREVEFVEFAVEGDSGDELVKTLAQLGFAETHQHRSKNVTLMRQGDVNLILNKEPKSQAHEYFQKHGVSVCALGFATDSVKHTLAVAEHYKAERFENQAGPGELNIPAIRGVGDSLVYFVNRDAGYRFFDVDFKPIDGVQGEQGVGLKRIDHIGQTVANVDFLSTGFFYKSLFGFDIQPSQDLPDIHGLVVSRTATNKDKSIRIPINMTNARSASAERFLTQTRGSGVQQIAFACDDIFTAAKNMDQEKVLTIPNNYYRDIEARFDLSEELIAKLKAHNILFDRNDQGEFFHFYTEQMHGVFFEVVQRVDGYDNYGEANAFVRLAAQAEQEKA